MRLVRVVAVGQDNGALVAIVKSYPVDASPDEQPAQITARERESVRADGLEVALSNVSVNVSVVD